MTLIASIKAAFVRAAGIAWRFSRVFLHGGPVGLFYAIKLARIKRRLTEVSIFIHRENELHRAHLAALNFEINELVAAQQSTNVAAAQFWRSCGAPTGTQS